VIESALCWLICARIQITKVEVKHEYKQEQIILRSTDQGKETNNTRSGKSVKRSPTGASSPSDKTAIIANSTNDKQAIIAAIQETFGKDAEQAIRIASCESGIRSEAIGHNSNGSRDYGIFQINSVHFGKIPVKDKVAYLLNADNNIALAYQIYQRQGWNPWVCKKVLAYLK